MRHSRTVNPKRLLLHPYIRRGLVAVGQFKSIGQKGFHLKQTIPKNAYPTLECPHNRISTFLGDNVLGIKSVKSTLSVYRDIHIFREGMWYLHGQVHSEKVRVRFVKGHNNGLETAFHGCGGATSCDSKLATLGDNGVGDFSSMKKLTLIVREFNDENFRLMWFQFLKTWRQL